MSNSESNKIMDGRALAKRMRDDAAQRVEKIREATGVTPCLATVLVGDDPASVAYTRMKRKRCLEARIETRRVELPAETTTERLVATVRELGDNRGVHAILVQHPVPKPIDKRTVFEAIPLEKDVDAVSSAALGRAILGLDGFGSCTPTGIVHLLREYKVKLDGASVVVIGRSPILGRPMASMLINAHATVTLCHSRTRDLADVVRRGDVLIVAMGQPHFIRGDWIKPGAVVVDAGYNQGNVGDVDFGSAVERAGLITPVPGGVGPMTIATLIDHIVTAAAAQLGVR